MTARFFVRVQPRAKQNQLNGLKQGVLHVRLTAPPIEGRANEALVKFLADCLGVARSHISIERGLTGRMKTIVIEGMTQSQAESTINSKLMSRN